MTVTGSFADALNWANVSNKQWSAALAGNSKAQSAFNKAVNSGMSVEDAFNEALKECSTTSERQQLVTAAMDAAYGDLGETYMDVNDGVLAANDASLKLKDAQAQLGDAIQPVTTNITNLLAGGLTWLVETGLPWLSTNLPIIAPIIAAIGAGFATWFILTTIVPAVTALVTGLGGLSGILAAITGPVGIAVLAVAGLAAGFVYLWNTSETFRTGVMNIWTTIQTVFGMLAEWLMTNVVTPIVTYFSSLWPQVQIIWDGISNIINIAITAISGFIQNNMGTIQAVWSSVWGVISSVASTIWGIIQTVINTALGVIQGVITTVTGIISGDWSQVWEGIKQIASSVWNGIKSVISNVINGIKGVISNVLNAIKTTFSSVFNGIKSTVSNIFNGIKNTISNVINGAKSTVENGLNAIKGFFSGLTLKFPDIKLPHFEISGSFSLNPPSVPSIGISWYAKGGILEAPTIFGAMGNTLLGGGEAGKEAVAPISELQHYMLEALRANTDYGMLEDLIYAVEDLANRPVSVEIDGRNVALATASHADRVSGSRAKLAKRGVSLA